MPDNGTELTLSAILKWQQDHNVQDHSIASGKSTQNRFVEAFNGQMADELFTALLFDNLRYARNFGMHGAPSSTIINRIYVLLA